MSRFGILSTKTTLATDFFDVEALNNYYAVTASKHEPVSQAKFSSIFSVPPLTPPTFAFNEISLSLCKKELDLACNSSSRCRSPDNLPIFYLQKILPAITPYIHYLFNLSIRSSKYPTQWKSAFITLLNKSFNTS